MLTGKLVRVKHAREKLLPYYLDVESAKWLEIAEQMIELFRSKAKDRAPRGELDQEAAELFGSLPNQLVHQGFLKLLQDRCEFETVAGHPPAEIRDLVFRTSAKHRELLARSEQVPRPSFDRSAVIEEVARSLDLSVDEIDQCLFADLKSEQLLQRFKDTTPLHLLQRYNVALAQGVLVRATGVKVSLRNETPQRYRQLFRQMKFRRLICEVQPLTASSVQLFLDGPMSLFSSTQKYGLQMALFLPTLLLCRDFDLQADVLWGPQRKRKTFALSSGQGLVTHAPDYGTYVPPELQMFVETFRKRCPEWEINEEPAIYPLGQEGYWVPDFRLKHRKSTKSVLLEVLGFWRRSGAEKHLARLRKHAKEPFLLAVSDQLKVDEEELEGLPAEIHRFRQMPLAGEIARLANELI